MSEVVQYEKRGDVVVITLDRPEARNAIDGRIARGLEAAIDRLESDDGARAGVIAGNGPVFCAGADLKAVRAGRGDEISTERGGPAGFTDRTRRKPVVAAVEGPALGGGCEIVLACDLIVASTTASFGLPEVKRSLLATAGGLYRLPRRVPRNVAIEMALTGEPISAARAERVGLVNVVCDPGSAVDVAVEIGRQIAANAPLAVFEARRVLLDGLVLDEPAAQAMTRDAMQGLVGTEDFGEGTAAFVEKREPRWSGR